MAKDRYSIQIIKITYTHVLITGLNLYNGIQIATVAYYTVHTVCGLGLIVTLIHTIQMVAIADSAYMYSGTNCHNHW